MGGLGHVARHPTEAGTRTSIWNARPAPCWQECSAWYRAGRRRRRWSAPRDSPEPSKRDRVIDRTAAGIQDDGHAAELSAARELIKFPWTIGGYDTGRADPAPGIGWQSTQVNLSAVACFEGDVACAEPPAQPPMRRRGRRRRAASSLGLRPNERDQRGSIGDAGALRGLEPRDCRELDRE